MRPLLVLFLALPVASGHQIAETPMTLELSGDRVVARIEADAAYMLEEFRGDEEEDGKDLAWLRAQGAEGWREIRRQTESYWRSCLRLETDGKDLPWRLDIPSLEGDPPPILREGEPEAPPMLDVVLEARLPRDSRKLEAVWAEPFGVVLIVTGLRGLEHGTTPLVPGERALVAERAAPAEAMRPAPSSFGKWIAFGYEHILPEGLDHILFVFGLFLLAPQWRPLLRQTIVFTLAHSASLAAAVLGLVRFPAAPVEIFIAASIAWVGIGNLRGKEPGPPRLALVAMFGLIHGLGFASVLAEFLPAGEAAELAGALLGFNLGVELGQLTVLTVAFATLGGLGDNFRHVKRAGSIGLTLAGLVLIGVRLAACLA